MAKKLFKIKVTQEFVAYLDEDIIQEDLEDFRNIQLSKTLQAVAKDYPYGSTTQTKITRFRSLKQLPREWDGGCVPYGQRVDDDIEGLLKRK